MKIKLLLLVCLHLVMTMGSAQQRTTSHPKLADLMSEADTAALKAKIVSLKNSSDESDLLVLADYYRAKKNHEGSTEIQNIMKARFPNGRIAFDALSDAIYNERDPDENEKKYRELITRWSKPPAGARPRSIDASRYYVAVTFLGKNRPEKVMEYLNMIQDTLYQTDAFSYAARESISTKDYVLGETLIRKTFDDLKRRGGDKPKGYDEYARIFSVLLFENGKYQEGFEYIKELYEKVARAGSRRNMYQGTYLNYLVALDQLKEAYPLMEEEIRSGNGSVALKAKFKDAFIAYKGSDAGFDEMSASISQALMEKIRADLEKKMTSEPAFDFVAKDFNEKTVRLSDYRGKVVILDFWATWCGPCKASFPMMQKAVDKYKNDDDVVFLFIHTMETSPNAAKSAKEYIADQKYTFQVLMDMKDPVTNINPAASGYKVRGIPSKFIIDGFGKIRFSVLGGSMLGEDAFLQEMAMMIEMAKEV